MREVFGYEKRPSLVEEVMDPKSKTEQSGYVPADVRIMEMILAGQRLGEYRREMYDFGPGEEVPSDYMDPTRSPGFDLADGSRMAESVGARLAEQEAAAKVRLAEEEKKKAEAAKSAGA